MTRCENVHYITTCTHNGNGMYEKWFSGAEEPKCAAQIFILVTKVPSNDQKIISGTTTAKIDKNFLAGTGESRFVSLEWTFTNKGEDQLRRTRVENTKKEEQTRPYAQRVQMDNEFSLSPQKEYFKRFPGEQNALMIRVTVPMCNDLKKALDTSRKRK